MSAHNVHLEYNYALSELAIFDPKQETLETVNQPLWNIEWCKTQGKYPDMS